MADSSKRAARLAKEITAFAQRHGGSAEGQIAYVGQAGARISLVGADGTWGDLMTPSMETARKATEQAGITVNESFAGEMADKVKTGPYEWSRMAGIQLGGPSGSTARA
ncbi:hypothetical protein G4Z16_27010 [Streptomyces bathyalis]|uniref:Uncharacterized protein n=1 Tax=Streptomyces bathyalis TaxID=2710756 RepID=A0A7T1WSS2_9ACTN|nr:hypothetical protein [Streptomyces bathyalis]QPP09458.1 hypothetical protein G4Z16_27010 [Streptomyces bathyalis]